MSVWVEWISGASARGKDTRTWPLQPGRPISRKLSSRAVAEALEIHSPGTVIPGMSHPVAKRPFCSSSPQTAARMRRSSKTHSPWTGQCEAKLNNTRRHVSFTNTPTFRRCRCRVPTCALASSVPAQLRKIALDELPDNRYSQYETTGTFEWVTMTDLFGPPTGAEIPRPPLSLANSHGIIVAPAPGDPTETVRRVDSRDTLRIDRRVPRVGPMAPE